MTIAVGDKLPEGKFHTMADDKPTEISTSEIFNGKKVVLFGVPGAFTSTCTNDHVPGYVDNYESLRANGIDTIAVISANDHFVMTAWAHATGGGEKILFLADLEAAYAEKLGLAVDLTARGLGKRYQRFSMVVDDGTVRILNIEPKPGQAIETGAARMLELL